MIMCARGIIYINQNHTSMAPVRDASGTRCLEHFDGHWTYAANATPLYREQEKAAARANPQSQRIRESSRCQNGRNWRWRWESNDHRCKFHHPKREQLCQRLSRRRLLFFGDSLTQQLFVSLASMAGNAIPAWKPVGCERMKHLECLHVCNSSSALICQRVKFGLAVDKPPHPPMNCTIKTSSVAALDEVFNPSCLRHFDVVMLSEAAHWVGNDGMGMLERCMAERGVKDAAAQSQMWVSDLYAKQMARNAEFLHTHVASGEATNLVSSGVATRIFFRTSAPAQPTADLLAGPLGQPTYSISWVTEMVKRGKAPYNHHLIPRLNGIARQAFSALGLGVMDVAEPMAYRVDGHLDPLHYCLPGPPDFLSETLYNFVLCKIADGDAEQERRTGNSISHEVRI